MPLGKETVVPASGNVRFAVRVPAMTDDEISLQILLNNQWRDIQTPLRTGSRASLSMGKIAVMDKTVKAGTSQLLGLNLSKPGELTGIVKELQERQVELESETADLKLERDSLKTELAGTKENLATAQNEIAESLSKLSVLETFKQEYDAKKTISLDSLLANTATQLNEAKFSAFKDNLGFAVGKVTMELKGVPANGMEEFEFLDKSEILSMNPNGLSSIFVSFDPAPGSVQIETPKANIPNILNLGERMAVRKLEEKGFVADIHYETTDKDSEEGRVLTQKPIAGQEIEVGSIVEIYIGKLLEKDVE
jgi:hypothetical protein